MDRDNKAKSDASGIVRVTDEDWQMAVKTTTLGGWNGASTREQLALQQLRRRVCWLAVAGRRCLKWEHKFWGGCHGAKH